MAKKKTEFEINTMTFIQWLDSLALKWTAQDRPGVDSMPKDIARLKRSWKLYFYIFHLSHWHVSVIKNRKQKTDDPKLNKKVII